MSQTGANSLLNIGVEATYGTTDTDAGFTLPFISTTVSAEKANIDSAVLSGNANPSAPAEGNTNLSGEIKVPVDNDAFYYWLQLAFGTPQKSGSADPWSHLFKIGNDAVAFSHEKVFTDLTTDRYYIATGCKISTMSMSFGGDEELTCTFGVVGSDEAGAASSGFTSPTVVTQVEKYSNLHATVKEGGSASVVIKSFDFTIEFGLDTDQRVIGAGGVLGAIPKGQAKVTGNIVAMYDIAGAGEAILAKAEARTESSLEITLTPADADHTLVIDFNELLYSYKSVGIPGPQGLVVELPFTAYYEGDAMATACGITLSNANEHA